MGEDGTASVVVSVASSDTAFPAAAAVALESPSIRHHSMAQRAKLHQHFGW